MPSFVEFFSSPIPMWVGVLVFFVGAVMGICVTAMLNMSDDGDDERDQG